MKKLLYFFLVPLSFCATAPAWTALDNLLMNQDDHLRIIVNNRVLANVNGKPITVIDIMKRMDILFLKQFPEYTSSVSARHQFYVANWKRTLSELVDKELILADAKESKMEVANGDIRQEMEQMFGPNIILNLDKIGLSLDEATKIVSGDIAIRRMMYVKVTSKALGKVTPSFVRSHYEEWAAHNTKPATVSYRMITIRNPEKDKGKEIAQKIYDTLLGTEFKHDELIANLAPYKDFLSLSDEFNHTDKDITPVNKPILASLSAGQASKPVEQKSRADNQTVYRLFLVTDKVEGSTPPFKDAEPEIKERLLDHAIDQEQKTYLTRLRKHFAVRESQLKDMIPEEFIPFSLK